MLNGINLWRSAKVEQKLTYSHSHSHLHTHTFTYTHIYIYTHLPPKNRAWCQAVTLIAHRISRDVFKSRFYGTNWLFALEALEALEEIQVDEVRSAPLTVNTSFTNRTIVEDWERHIEHIDFWHQVRPSNDWHPDSPANGRDFECLLTNIIAKNKKKTKKRKENRHTHIHWFKSKLTASKSESKSELEYRRRLDSIPSFLPVAWALLTQLMFYVTMCLCNGACLCVCVYVCVCVH